MTTMGERGLGLIYGTFGVGMVSCFSDGLYIRLINILGL
jgi:hypothetical protein